MEGQGSEGNVGEGTKQDMPKQEATTNHPPPGDYQPQSSQTQQPPTYQQGYSQYPSQQYPAAPGPGMSTFVGRFRRTDKVIQMIVLGIILMFIGGIIIGIVTSGEGPKPYDEKYDGDDDGRIDDDDKTEEYWEDWRLHNGITYVGTLLGTILIYLGMLMAVLALLIGGIVNNEIDRYIRIGMIIAAGFILAWIIGQSLDSGVTIISY
jgi:MFS family permease